MKCNPIRGKTQLFQPIPAKVSDAVHQGQYVAAYGRFSACQSDLGDALRDEKRGNVDYFGGGEKVGWWREWHTFFGHAVQTPKIAALGYADAEVVVLARVVVGEEGRKGFGVPEVRSSRR